MVDPAIDFVVRLSSDTYESLFYQMPQKQRAVFLAIASEGKATEVMSGSFVKKELELMFMNEEHKYIDFEAYARVAEPHKREKASAGTDTLKARRKAK